MTVEDVAEQVVKILIENPASAGRDLQKIIDNYPGQLKEALLCLYQIMQAPELFLPHLCAEDKATVAYKLGGIYGELLNLDERLLAKCKALKN